MYIIINLKDNTARVTNFKQSVADLIGVHRNTINNNLKKQNPSEINGFTIYEAVYIKGRVTKGNRDNLATRKLKAQQKEDNQP